jgi:uncharacterized protein YndB with AHSA1/START domain
MDRIIVESIEIEAPPERVFAAWVDPEQLVEWWGDSETYHVTRFESDNRVGGKWVSHGKSINGKPFSVEGEYLQFDPPTRLVMTWQSDWAADGRTVVDLEFKPTAKGTLLTVKHTGFGSDESTQNHRNGWHRVTGWLKAFVESVKAAAT